MEGMTHAVTGWGYEGHTIEDLLDECARLRAAYVVDIRLNAISRKKGFSKTALSNVLAGAGVEYVHLRALGNPKDNRPGFAHPGTPEAERAHKRFNEEVLDTPEAARQLGELAELSRRGNVIVLCFEETPKCCHRHLVIQRLQAHEKAVASV
ncbi:DUF488 domain-containing protein [Schaalia georgiae]|nr:DUF488 domain-containing protein [Schaalia georgiae]